MFSWRSIDSFVLAKDDPTQSQRSAAFWSVFGVVCSLVALLTISDLPWEDIGAALGCPWYNVKCCAKGNANDEDQLDMDRAHYPGDNDTSRFEPQLATTSKPSNRGMNYHVMNTVWNPEHLRPETSTNGFHSPNQSTTPDNVLIQSFAAAMIEKRKQKQLEEKRVYAVNLQPTDNVTAAAASKTDRTTNPTETMISWTQQLQEQLKSRSIRQASANSTRDLIEPERFIDE